MGRVRLQHVLRHTLANCVFGALIKSEHELYRKLIPEIGIKPQ